MSELIQQVNKLRQDVSSGQSSEQSTKTSDTKPYLEPSAQVVFPYLSLLCAFSDHLFHLLTLSPCSGTLNFTPSEALYAPRKKDQSADTLPIPYSKYIERSKVQIQHKYSCPQIS